MKKILCAALSAALCLSLLCPAAFALKGVVIDPAELPYVMNDSTPSSWAQSEISAAQAAGLIPELTGNPGYQDHITREQFAELAVALMQVLYGQEADMSKAEVFTDCSNPQVLAASAFGIVNGVGGGKYDPKQKTNREQIATMVNRAILSLDTLTGVNAAPKAGDISAFRDKDQVSSWAKEGVGVLAVNEIMQGAGGKLSPKDPCTVEQSILLIYRVYQKYNERA